MKSPVDALKRLHQPRIRRRVLVMSDQAASSFSNVIVAILVARSFESPKPFGAFSLSMIVGQLIIGGTRSLAGHTLLSVYSPLDPAARKKVVPDLLGLALCVGYICTVILAAASVILGGMIGSALLALGIVIPLVLMQDTWRFAFIVDRAGAALTIDLIWLIAVLTAFVFAPTDANVSWYIIVWGLSGGLGALVGIVLAGGINGRPRPSRWLLSHREVGFRFFGEFLTARAVGHLVASSVGAISGLAALGSVKASQVYYGPHNTLQQGMYMLVVPEGAQTRDRPERLRRIMILVSLGLAILSALWMSIGLVLPTSWGEALFGGTWVGAREIMLPMGVAMIGAGLSSGGLLGLRSLADAKRSLRARLRITPWLLVCPVLGTFWNGAVGFAMGYALAWIVSAVVWWLAFIQALHSRVASAEPVSCGSTSVSDGEEIRVTSALGVPGDSM